MENVKQSSSSQLTKIELSKLLGLCILLTLFGIAIYSKVANFGYVPYDDAAFITENKFVRCRKSMASHHLAVSYARCRTIWYRRSWWAPHRKFKLIYTIGSSCNVGDVADL